MKFKITTAINENKKYDVVYRAWVNAPSTLQKEHRLHGVKGIVYDTNKKDRFVRFFPVEGNTVSTMVDRLYLEDGWK